MNRALATGLISVCAMALTCPAQESPQTPQAPSLTPLQQLLKEIKEREKTAESVSLELETEGTFPDGSRFRTSGTLRVLGTTHLHSLMTAHFGDDIQAETETVKTPEGVSMREKDPVQGEIYLHMDADLMNRLQSATEHLGKDANMPGVGGPEGPLGSALLEDLDREFDLTVEGPKVIDGQECWVVKGPLRGEKAPDGTSPDAVDIIVRRQDAAVIRMTQLRDEKPIVEVRILRMDMKPLDAESFVLEIPENASVIDIMQHPPARAQIDRILEEAREGDWVDPAGKSKPKAPANARAEADQKKGG